MEQHDLTVQMVSVESIGQHPRNANHGDVDAIAESIQVNGFYSPIIVQRSTGFIVAGNHRYLAACQQGAKEVPVIYLDVDDERAHRIMLADNRTTRLGFDDEVELTSLLRELYATDTGLGGTGYDSFAFTKLLSSTEEALKFDSEPMVDPRVLHESAEPPDRKVMVTPVTDSDGAVYALEVAKVAGGTFSKADFKAVCKALGIENVSQAEIDAFVVPQWRS